MVEPVSLIGGALTLVLRVKETVDNVRDAPELAKNLKGRCLALEPHLKTLRHRRDLHHLFHRVEAVLEDVFTFLTKFFQHGWMLRVGTYYNIHHKFEELNVAIDRVVADMLFAVGVNGSGNGHNGGGNEPQRVALTATPSKRSLETQQAVVDSFIDRYHDVKFQKQLELLRDKFAESPFHHKGWGAWADATFLTFRRNKEDPDAVALNNARRFCLQLLYDMVDLWQANDFSDAFREAIATRFKTRRLSSILQPCLPLDRAHALYVLKHPGSRLCGKEWFCKLHLDPSFSHLMGQPGYFSTPKEQAQWRALATQREQEYRKYDDEFKPPMNKRLFRLLYCDRFELQPLRHWAQPRLVPSRLEQQHLEQSFKDLVPLKRQVENLKRQLQAMTTECQTAKKALQSKTRECHSLQRELATYRNQPQPHGPAKHPPQPEPRHVVGSQGGSPPQPHSPRPVVPNHAPNRGGGAPLRVHPPTHQRVSPRVSPVGAAKDKVHMAHPHGGASKSPTAASHNAPRSPYTQKNNIHNKAPPPAPRLDPLVAGPAPKQQPSRNRPQ